MKIKRVPFLLVTVVSLALVVGLAGATASVTRYGSKVTIKGNPAFRGRVTSSKAACIGHRTVEVRDASNHGLYGSVTTKSDGHWELLSSPGLHGNFYARVTARVLHNGSVCGAARSATEVHL
jgi:hypothetical protein